jgi:ankyrin repeat protein
LAAGMEPDQDLLYGKTALQMAAALGHKEQVQALLNAGAQVDGADSNGNTPLMLAAAGAYAEVLHLLLDHGADPNQRNNSGMSAAAWALSMDAADCAELLQKRGAGEPYGRSELQLSIILATATVDTNTPDWQALLNAAEDLNHQDVFGITALMLAAEAGFADLVKALLSRGASVHLQDQEGLRAIDWAVEAEQTACIALLRATKSGPGA